MTTARCLTRRHAWPPPCCRSAQLVMTFMCPIGNAVTGTLTFGAPRSANISSRVGCTVAGLVPGAALQHDRLAVPAPGHAEAGQRLGQHRRIERGFRPALAAVGRDHHLRDPAIARIGEAGNLVEARSLERQPGRRVGDEGLDLHREEELPDFRTLHPVGVLQGLVDGHHRLLDQLDPVQPFDVHVALVAGHQQPHRIAVATAAMRSPFW